MTIADNKKAYHDYFIEDRYEAGIVLEGWEVKAIRDARVQIKEAYVVVRGDELFLFGAHISALPTASTHIHPEAVRTRKLLLHKAEILKLIGKTKESGHALVPLSLYFKDGRAKVEIALAKGRKAHDKRQALAERQATREMQVEVGRAMKGRMRGDGARR